MRLALLGALLAGQAAAGPVYFEAPKRSIEARDAPGGAVVGLLPGGAGFVEALETDSSGEWALVALAESGGWIPLAGLTPAQPPAIAGTAIPDGLRCIGTEPFWSVRFSTDGATHERPDGGENALGLSVAAWPDGAAMPLPVRLRNEGMDFIGLLDHAACSDGMSDRPYGWTLSIGQRGAGPAGAARTGCCFLPRGG
jgi:uncharacterized membrane protein